MITNDDLENAQNAQNFTCINCDFTCSKKSNYSTHLLTSKHFNNDKMITNDDDNTSITSQYICECGKKYKYRQGLHTHKKKCNKTSCETQNNDSHMIVLMKQLIEKTPANEVILELMKQNKELMQEKTSANNDELVAELLKQNNEFKELMLEQSKYMLELANKAGNNTNCNNINNKTFNLTFYLNETCKDAINIDDFIQSVALQLSDLDYTRKYGYVAGITNILLRGLKAIDVNKRPFHCCDIKREIIYIKHDGVWEKDDNNKSKMIKAIKQISHRNFLQIEEWRNKNPSSRDVESKKNTEYLYIMREVLGGPTPNNDANSYNKIIRNIMKEILIDK